MITSSNCVGLNPSSYEEMTTDFGVLARFSDHHPSVTFPPYDFSSSTHDPIYQHNTGTPNSVEGEV